MEMVCEASGRLGRPVFKAALAAVIFLTGCQAPKAYRQGADQAAQQIIQQKQQEALGKTEPFTISIYENSLRKKLLLEQGLPYSGPASLGSTHLERPEHWPEKSISLAEEAASNEGAVLDGPVMLTLAEALQVGARHNGDYQERKEEIFRVALDLDLKRDEFRNSLSGLIKGLASSEGGDERVSGLETSGEGSISRVLKTGAELTARIALDLVRLLTQGGSSSLGILADATISIPLLRGAGRHVAAEPLTRAERDMLYAIWDFERYKRTFAVQTAVGYLGVLQALKEVENAEENYRGLIAATRRSRRLADAGRLPEFEFDQAVQNELRSRNRWISARENYKGRLDSFKIQLGLPPDADLKLDRDELEGLFSSYETLLVKVEDDLLYREVPPADAPIILEEPARPRAGPLEMEEERALGLALENRLDLRVVEGRVRDAQRSVVVAADGLRPGLNLLGSAQAGESRSIGSADSPDAEIDLDRASGSALVTLDLPLERTAERNEYRKSLISLEKAVRNFQELEDQIKLEVRNKLRNFLEYRESVQIQVKAVRLAERRVRSTDFFLQAGRAEIRDLLEAQEALITTQNALAAAVISYRIAELELQRDLGLLEVDEKGIWKEYGAKEGVNSES